MMMHMHMTFYWGTTVTLLFDSFHVHTLPAYSLALASCFLFAILYQFLEDRRIKLKLLAAGRPISPSPVEIPILHRKIDVYSRWSLARGVTESLLFGADSAIAYLLMLAVMSFNGGVFCSVVLGLFVGYLLFRSGGGDVLLVVDDTCACA